MKIKIKPYITLGSFLAFAGLLGFANNSSAAMITAPATGEINLNGDVDIIFNDTNGNGIADGGETFTFDFVPPGTGTGDLASLSATSCSGSFVDFCSGASASAPAVHITLDVPASPALGGALPINNFITLVDPTDSADANDFFDLTSIGILQLTPTSINGQISTAASVSVEGMWESEDGTLYNGVGTYTTQFVGLDQAQTITQLLSGTTVSKSISANYNITPKDVAIPESDALAGLALILGSTFMGLKKKAKTQA